MTIIVGIKCTDGVVIGADSSATSFVSPGFPIIEDHTQKIDILEDRFIIAGSGMIGIQQRLQEKCRVLISDPKIRDQSKIEFGKTICNGFTEEFSSTNVGVQDRNSSLVAYDSNGEAILMEISLANTHMQPEWKELNQLWYVSIGSGQQQADPFLAFLRSVYVSDKHKAPNLQLGKFMVFWTVHHVCNVNPGGVKEPIYLATLGESKNECVARMVSHAEKSQLRAMIGDVTDRMSSYLDS